MPATSKPSDVAMPASLADPCGRQYKIAEKLGKGGFAVCYRADIDGRSFALKVSHTSDMNEKLREKMITELQIHSKVRHANIIQFHRAFSVEENTYIQLEICTNGTLKEMLAARSRISMPETRRFGMQLCGALHYLHSRRVIHRDIKTANILLDEKTRLGVKIVPQHGKTGRQDVRRMQQSALTVLQSVTMRLPDAKLVLPHV